MSKATTIVLAVLLLACLVVAIFVATPESPPSPLPAQLLAISREEVRSVDVRNGAGEVHLERDATDRERWRVRSGTALVRADSTKVEDLLHELTRLEPKNLFPAKEVKPADRTTYGLDKPGVEATVAVEGRTMRVAFGNRTPENRNTYAEKDAKGDVYVVRATALEKLEGANPASFREMRPVGFSTYDVKTLSVVRADGVRLEAERASGGTWEVTVPYKGGADPVKYEPFLSKILSVTVLEFVADGDLKLEEFGLLEPRAVITMRREGREKPVILRLGKDAPDGGGKAYFMEDGEPSVYICGPELPKAIAELDPPALRDRNLLRIGWAKIDSIEFAPRGRPEAGWRLLRVLDRWDLEKPERVPAEAGEVDRLLDDLRKLEASKFLDGEDPAKHGLAKAEEAEARLVLTGTDESGSRTVLLGKRDAEGNLPARLLPPKDAKGDPPVAMLGPDLLDRLEKGWLSFRDLEVLKTDLSEVRGLSKKEGGVVEHYLREKDGSWKAAPGGKEPDRDALTRVLSHLLTVKCVEYVAKTKEGLEKWGLGDPPAGPVVTLHLRKDSETAERTRILVLGTTPEGGGSHYARLADGDMVFRLADSFVNGSDIVPFFSYLDDDWAKAEPPPAPLPEAPKDEPKEDGPKKDEAPAEPEKPK